MTKNIITETPGQRNRRLFCKALAAGCHVVSESDGEFTVTSKSGADKQYIVTLDNDDEGRMIVHCTCDWSSRIGWMLERTDSPACCHMLIVRWHNADDAMKDRAIALHPDIAAAAFVARYAVLQQAA